MSTATAEQVTKPAGIPTIALFRNSDVCRWGPLGPAVSVLEADDPTDEFMEQVVKGAEKWLGPVKQWAKKRS